MTIFEKGLVTILVVDALSILISIPLVLRKIGPNVVYGYRTRATLSDPALWYEANALFGRRLIAACTVSALAALFLARPGLLSPDAFLPVSVVLLGAPVAVAGVMTSRFVARVTKG
ncbi:MAG TPA: SdpI family protein [Thermoanaerobaculia bacterium]|mgnify:FL=1|nr:SdpI family protein [Thermoanaerobaculia bacterium]HQN06897.1 SdpI family protein [Thermoanaerobaculia bacterium]HQP84814.1 SdpI family protein [Thermoanaerobaculia bacterium]